MWNGICLMRPYFKLKAKERQVSRCAWKNYIDTFASSRS